MTDEPPIMVGSATVFAVSDIEASLAYYRDVLGFQITFGMGMDAAACGRPRPSRSKSDPRLQDQVEGCLGGAAEA